MTDPEIDKLLEAMKAQIDSMTPAQKNLCLIFCVWEVLDTPKGQSLPHDQRTDLRKAAIYAFRDATILSVLTAVDKFGKTDGHEYSVLSFPKAGVKHSRTSALRLRNLIETLAPAFTRASAPTQQGSLH